MPNAKKTEQVSQFEAQHATLAGQWKQCYIVALSVLNWHLKPDAKKPEPHENMLFSFFWIDV